MIGLSILIGAYWIADAVMFVHGYKSYWFCAKTDQEKLYAKRSLKPKASSGMENNESLYS